MVACDKADHVDLDDLSFSTCSEVSDMEYLDCSSEPVYTPLLTSKSGVSECDEDFSQLQIAVEKQKPVDVKETFPETEDYMLQLSRLQDKVASFYQLPELNNKPVDFVPRLDYVASQYELPEMREYSVHNQPLIAQKLKAENLISNKYEGPQSNE